MSRLLSTEPVAVLIGDCECPEKPHGENAQTGKTGDHAYLRPRLTPEAGMACTRIIADARTASEMSGELGMAWLVFGLLRWDLLDDSGEAIPHDEATLRSGAISWEDTLLPIADAASDLYGEGTLRPFVTRPPSRSSRNGRAVTRVPTSASPTSSRRTRKQ